jgi:hemolysin III
MDLLIFREPVSAWSHCSWLLLSVPGTVLLCLRSRGDLGKQLSLLIFGLSLAICYAGSTLFHGVRLPVEQIAVFNLIDYIGIYILIAGSYTPLAWNLLQGRWRSWTLSVVWSTAALCAGIQVAWGMLPLSVATLTYLVMGWGAILCYLEIARRHSHAQLRLILIGGMFYTVGALINQAQWPDPWPGLFGRHEIFHLFVMAGSLSHFWFMLTFVAPYRSTACEDVVAAPSATRAPKPVALEAVYARAFYPERGRLGE